MAKKLKWQDVDDPALIQQNLFLSPGVAETSGVFPPIYRDFEGVEAILQEPQDGLGLDLEFNPKTGRPSILGVSNRRATSGVPWDSELGRRVVEVAERHKVRIVGHSVIGADRPIIEGALDIKTPLAMWDDTMLRHYLCNPDLCKTPGKDEDDDDTGAMGFMNLWTMASLHTTLPQWKVCRGKACDGPCPVHDPFGYCAVDSWAGLESKFGLVAEMEAKRIPESLHEDLSVLSEITHLMETRGIRINREYVNEMEKNFEEHKLEIFPIEYVNGKPVYSPFNPKSVPQIQAYFASKGIDLKDTDKKNVRKSLERETKKRGIDFGQLATAPSLPEEIDALYRLLEFKDAGKGLKSWFDARYVDDNGFIHPRFIVPGTSMGRLASSRPNFQNIPARGFGARVRKAIVPRDPSYDLIEADFSQLEFRKILHTAGYDLKRLVSDPFVDLVTRSGGALIPAAKFMFSGQFDELGPAKTQRQVAKSVVHAYDLLEGFTVVTSKDLDRRKKEIDAGALLVHRDWEYRGGLVAFTGGNLAERLFGSKSWQDRKRALDIQELMTAEFPIIRQFHRRVLREIEDHAGIRLPSGRFLPLYGNPEDDAKMAAAMHGQGGGADFVQGIMLRYYREQQRYPLIQVHDSLTWEIPRDWGSKQVHDLLWMMGQEDPRTPGFFCSFDAKRGPNWGEMSKVELKF